MSDSNDKQNDDRERIFVVRGSRPAFLKNGTPVMSKYEVLVRAKSDGQVRKRMDALLKGLPYEIEEALICSDDRLTDELLRQAKMQGHEVRYTEFEPATEGPGG